MAKINEIEVNVNVKMSVDDDTAYKALSILDIWLDGNSEREIEFTRFTDGTHCLNLRHESTDGKDQLKVKKELVD